MNMTTREDEIFKLAKSKGAYFFHTGEEGLINFKEKQLIAFANALSQPNEPVGIVVNGKAEFEGMVTYGRMYIDLPDETLLFSAPQVAQPNDPLEEIQFRNIKKVVVAIADLCFGSKDDEKYGHCWIALVNSLTAKDGLDIQSLNLEKLAPPNLEAKEIAELEAKLAWLEVAYKHVDGTDIEIAELTAKSEKMRERLTKIASLTQDTDLTWWQVEARQALEECK